MKEHLFIFIKGYFDTLDLFSEELIEELRELGAEYFVLHGERMQEDLPALMTALSGAEGKTALVFNNLGYNMGEAQGANLWELLSIRYTNILMDHPFHFDRQLRKLPQGARVCCIDRRHVTYLNRYYPQIAQTAFLPHGGCAHRIAALPEQKERDIDVLYAGNLSRVLIESLIPDFGTFSDIDGAAFSQHVLEELVRNPGQTTEEAICRQLRKEGLSLSREEELFYINGFRFLDGFAVSYYRELAVRILVEHGIRVHVLGIGWETCDFFSSPNLICEGKVDAPDVFPYMKRAKIVLNTLTWFKEGAHDRIFNGMLCGAAVVTDASAYLLETFENHKELEMFSLREIGRLPQIADALLADDERRIRMAERGRRKALAEHTWKNRLQTLLSEEKDRG